VSACTPHCIENMLHSVTSLEKQATVRSWLAQLALRQRELISRCQTRVLQNAGEHCPLMLRALQELGYDARLRAGEVMLNGEYTARWGHRTVWVECEGATYLLDVSSMCHHTHTH
jgi:N-acetyltransferase